MQLPWVTLPEDKRFDVINSVGDALVSGKKRRDERDRLAAEQLRNKDLDAEQKRLHDAQIANYQSEADQRKHVQDMQDAKDHLAAAKEIQSALDAGKNDQANLIAKSYKVKLQQEQLPESQQAGNTLMPMSTERRGAPTDEQVQQDAAGSAAAIAANPEMNEPGAPPANSPGLVKDLYNSRSAARFESQAPAAPKTAAWNIDGTRYDPAQTKAAEDATREEEAKRVEGAYGNLGFGAQAGALVRGNTGKAPEVDQAYIATQKAKEAEANKEALLGKRNDFTTLRDERNKMDVATQLSEAAKNRAARIAAAQAGGGGARTDQSTLAAVKYADQVVKDGEKELGLPKLNENMATIDTAIRELGKPSGAAQIGGRMALEKALRGGPPTQYMDQMEAAHIGGLWSRLEGAVSTAATGEMSPGQIQAIMHEAEAAKEAMGAARDRRIGAIKGRLSRDPALANLHGTVNNRYRQMAEGYGAPSEDIFPGEDNAVPAVGANSAANRAKPTVGDKLKGAARKAPPADDAAERKKRLLMELSGG